MASGTTGMILAEGKEDALRRLGNARLSDIKVSMSETLSAYFGKQRVLMTQKEAGQFSKQLSIFLRVIPDYPEAVSMAFSRFTNKSLTERRLKAFRLKLKSGSRVVEALEASGFPHEYTPVLKIAEDSNALADTMERVALAIEERRKLKASLLNALVTPMLTIAVLILTFIFMLLYVFPKLIGLFLSTKGAASSGMAMSFDIWLVDNKISILIVVLSLVAVFVFALVNPIWRSMLLVFLMRTPFFKDLVYVYRSTKLLLSLEMLIASGRGITDTVQELLKSSRSDEKKLFRIMLNALNRGTTFGDAILSTGYYPKDLSAWISNTEKAGELASQIPYMRTTYEQLLTQKFETLKTWFAPITLGIASVLILVVAAALYAPVLQLVQNFMSAQ